MSTDMQTATLEAINTVNRLCDGITAVGVHKSLSLAQTELLINQDLSLAKRYPLYRTVVDWLTCDSPHDLATRACALNSVVNALCAQLQSLAPLFGVHVYQTVNNGETEAYHNKIAAKKIDVHQLPFDMSSQANKVLLTLSTRQIFEAADGMLNIIDLLNTPTAAPKAKM